MLLVAPRLRVELCRELALVGGLFVDGGDLRLWAARDSLTCIRPVRGERDRGAVRGSRAQRSSVLRHLEIVLFGKPLRQHVVELLVALHAHEYATSAKCTGRCHLRAGRPQTLADSAARLVDQVGDFSLVRGAQSLHCLLLRLGRLGERTHALRQLLPRLLHVLRSGAQPQANKQTASAASPKLSRTRGLAHPLHDFKTLARLVLDLPLALERLCFQRLRHAHAKASRVGVAGRAAGTQARRPQVVPSPAVAPLRASSSATRPRRSARVVTKKRAAGLQRALPTHRALGLAFLHLAAEVVDFVVR